MAKIDSYGNVVPTDNDQLLGTDSSASDATKNFTFTSVNDYIAGKKVTAPASAAATGTAGDYAVATGFIYICVATDTWQRVATATW